MPPRSTRFSIAAVRRRLPFGIGTLVGVLCVALVITAGLVLSSGSGQSDRREYDYGLLRNYQSAPKVAWTLTDAELPGYTGIEPISVDDTYRNTWLVSYRSGIGRAFMAIDRRTGERRWDKPVRAGLGDCAFTETGEVGCAIDLGDPPKPGFYLIGGDGTITGTSKLLDTASMFGVGPNFLRINKFGYQVSLVTPTGRVLWTQRFAKAVVTDEIQISAAALLIPTTDGSEYALRRSDGAERVTCTQCRMRLYPGGLAVQYNETDHQRVAMFAVTDVRFDSEPAAMIPDVRVLPGASTMPVLTPADSFDASHGSYFVHDSSSDDTVWQINQPETSKNWARPCGSLFSVARIDRSRVTFTLADGTRVGEIAAPGSGAAPEEPNTNIDNLLCLGSSGHTLVFANTSQITAFAPGGQIAWTFGIVGGRALVVDGYIAVTQGTTLSLLRPH